MNRSFLKGKYPNIKEFFRISCARESDPERDRLQEEIEKLLGQMEFRNTLFAPGWLAVRDRIKEIRSHYITYKEFYDICDEYGVKGLDQQQVLLSFLNDLGVILHFQNLQKYGQQVLNPKWLTNGVYRIINSPLIAESQGGVVRFAQLNGILNDFERYNKEEEQEFDYRQISLQHYLIDIMKEFELCYELEAGKVFIIPDLLPVEEPEDIEYESFALHFLIDYRELLPRSILPRFMGSNASPYPRGGKVSLADRCRIVRALVRSHCPISERTMMIKRSIYG